MWRWEWEVGLPWVGVYDDLPGRHDGNFDIISWVSAVSEVQKPYIYIMNYPEGTAAEYESSVMILPVRSKVGRI